MSVASVRPVDPDSFRHAIGHFMTGVTVLTASHDGSDCGATASAVTSLSLEPPMLVACLNLQAATHEAIASSGRFGVNILGEHQAQLAKRFATQGGDKFEGVAFHRGRFGVAMLEGALARLECRVVDSVVGGTHRVFLAEVCRTEVLDGEPLAYYRGAFGRFEGHVGAPAPGGGS